MKNSTFSFCSRIAMLLLFSFSISQTGIAQNVGSNTQLSVQDTSIRKDLKASNNGKVVLRVALTGTTDNTTIKGTTTNLLIYNTASAGVSPNNVYPGYYNNVGTTAQPVWKRVDVTVSTAVKNKQ